MHSRRTGDPEGRNACGCLENTKKSQGRGLGWGVVRVGNSKQRKVGRGEAGAGIAVIEEKNT